LEEFPSGSDSCASYFFAAEGLQSGSFLRFVMEEYTERYWDHDTLPARRLCRIVDHPEYIEKPGKGDYGRIKHDADCFNMSGQASFDLIVARSETFPRCSRQPSNNAVNLPEFRLNIPETTCCKVPAGTVPNRPRTIRSC